MTNIFSEGVREDISKNIWKTADEWRAELSGACYTLDLFCRNRLNSTGFLIIRTDSIFILKRMIHLLDTAGFQPIVSAPLKKQGKTSLYISLHQREALNKIMLPIFDETEIDRWVSEEHLRRAFLRGAFLVAGSVSHPKKMYRIEMTVRNREIIKPMMLFFHAQDLTPSIVNRDNRVVIYLRDSEQIADFLAFIGAHRSRIKFEDMRTEKEIRNQVNRVVNCDTANALRQAEAGYNRSTRIRKLMHSSYVAQVPDELQLAARVLLDNPGASIRELGQLMQPPISKSGMHHRLKKLEKIAQENDLV